MYGCFHLCYQAALIEKSAPGMLRAWSGAGAKTKEGTALSKVSGAKLVPPTHRAGPCQAQVIHVCMPVLEHPDWLIPLRGVRVQVPQEAWGVTLYRHGFQGLRQFGEKYRGWQRKTGLGRPGRQVSDPFPGRRRAQASAIMASFHRRTKGCTERLSPLARVAQLT